MTDGWRPREGEQEDRNELRLADPFDERDRLTILGSALFAASKKVDESRRGGIAQVKKVLRAMVQAPDKPIATWDAWAERVQSRATHLLVIIPHVLQDDQPTMEIGGEDRLLAVNVRAEHVRTPEDRQPPPVVVLLGCPTGKADFPFNSLVAPVRRRGAAIVLCTGSSILGRHAAPVAVGLLRALKAATTSPAPRSFGDVLLDVRRTMVLKELPMIFTVLAFGDFDWQIGGEPAAAEPVESARKETVLVTP